MTPNDSNHSKLLKIIPDHSKLDGVGPFDNRPSTDYLHHNCPKKEKISIYIFVM